MGYRMSNPRWVASTQASRQARKQARNQAARQASRQEHLHGYDVTCHQPLVRTPCTQTNNKAYQAFHDQMLKTSEHPISAYLHSFEAVKPICLLLCKCGWRLIILYKNLGDCSSTLEMRDHREDKVKTWAICWVDGGVCPKRSAFLMISTMFIMNAFRCLHGTVCKKMCFIVVATTFSRPYIVLF